MSGDSDVNSNTSLDQKRISIESEFKCVELRDLEIITTLGIGGFGRVELVGWTLQGTYASACDDFIDQTIRGYYYSQFSFYTKTCVSLNSNVLFPTMIIITCLVDK